MGSKGLRVKRILIVFALIGLVFSVSMAKGAATQRVSVLYSDLNVDSWTEYEVPTGNYTTPYTVKITPSVTWNATTSNARFQLNFRNASATYQDYLIEFSDAGVLVCVYNGTQVGATTFTMDTEITIKVQSDGYTVNNGSGVQVTFYGDFSFPIDGVFARGNVVDTTTAGTVIVEFNDGGDFGLDIITDMIPIIVTIAILGAVLKMFRKIDI